MATVVFDLDGTLADTSRDLIAAANHCFRGMGLGDVLDPVTDAGVALRGGKRMLTEGLTRRGLFADSEVERWYPVLLDAYDAAIDHHTTLYPGTMEAVEALKMAGHAVSICTNKPERLAERLMASLGVRDAFAALVGADTLPVRKPDPLPYRAAVERAGGRVAQSCLVGDSLTDRNTARAAGVPCVLVTFPPGAEDVHAMEAAAVIDRFDQLPGVVAGLFPRLGD